MEITTSGPSLPDVTIIRHHNMCENHSFRIKNVFNDGMALRSLESFLRKFFVTYQTEAHTIKALIPEDVAWPRVMSNPSRELRRRVYAIAHHLIQFHQTAFNIHAAKMHGSVSQ